MHGHEVHDETRLLGEPSTDVFPMMGTDVITHEMTRADLLVHRSVQPFEKGAICVWSLPLIALAIDRARTDITGRTEVERPGPLVRMRVAVRNGRRLRWQGRRVARSRLAGRRLVHRQDQRLWAPWTGIQVAQLGYGGREGGGPRLFGREPHLLAPGVELRRRPHPAYGGHRDGWHPTLREELARQCGPSPWREATPQPIRAFASQAPEMDGHLWGKNRPWPRGQERR